MTEVPNNLHVVQSSTQRAVSELRDLIFKGELAAGSNHLEKELAARLGMSRTPVREATLVLSEQGLLEVRPRKGVHILPLSSDDMREIYEVLTELESLAAERAAAAKYSDEALAELVRAINEMDTALKANDLDSWAEADDRFHTELVRLGQNSRLNAIVAMMADQVRRARYLTLRIRPLPFASNEQHRALLEAIRAGDPKAARAIHRQHRDEAQNIILELLEKLRFHHF